MKILHKISVLILSFFCTATAKSANIVWFDGHNPVGYIAHQSYSPVVKTAIGMFADDMKAVTGHRAEENHKGKIEIIELNSLTNKEFKKIQKRKLPYQEVIAKPEAFYIGVHDGRLIVMGDDARGTAYGIMELSRMAGVSPWIWWGDVVPERRKRLETDDHFSTLQRPSVTARGIAITGEDWFHHGQNTQKLFELMLRLRANTVYLPAKHQKSSAFAKECRKKAESFGFSVESRAQNSLFSWEDDSQWLTTTQPGLIFHKAKKSYGKNTWIATVRNPKTAAYQLSLFLDMAWNQNNVKNGVEQHLEAWLKQQFGKEAGHKLLPVMRKFYELTAVQKPELTGRELFSAHSFGNELERYLGEYSLIQRLTENIKKTVRPELRDAYFAAVEYPILAAAAIAVKQLEAQESRHIARKESFHRDSEALGSAARSIKAWRKLQQLTQHYNEMAGGKWKRLIPTSLNNLPAFAEPILPDVLSEAEIKKYGDDEDYEIQINSNGCIAKNAADFATATENAEIVPMLGCSMRAVALPKGETLTYQFRVPKYGKGILRISTVKTTAETPLFYVTIDNGEKKIYSPQDATVALWMGTHTLTIESLSDDLILDQWMIDNDPKRKFYRFPL